MKGARSGGRAGRLRGPFAGALALALAAGAAPAAAADAAAEPTVAEEILEILREQGDISERQYEELSERARAERAAARTPEVAAGPESWKVYWKDGARIERRDGAFEFRLGGRLMNDWAFFDVDSDTEDFFGEDDLDGSGTEFRRARLFASGVLWEWVEFKAQYDFAGGDAELKDAFLNFTGLPVVGNLRVGHFKEPFSLEEQTSSKYITLMERSLANDAFSPGRNTGIALHDHALDERLTWAIGAFRDADDFGEGFDEDTSYNLTGRVTGLPWYADEGRKLLHLGLSYSHQFRDEDDGLTRFRARPEAHLSPIRVVDTGRLASDDVDLVNPELALVVGPFSLQSEYLRAFTDTSSGEPDFDGYYVEASWFLTGEHRSYETDEGAFGRVTPRRSFGIGRGPGAWQVALRFSAIDLEEEGVLGGELDTYGLGVNWHLNRNVRAMFNYLRTEGETDAIGADGSLGLDDGSNLFQARLQIDF